MRAIWIAGVITATMLLAPAVRAQGGDQQAGSVLMYNYYRSGALSGNTDNTRFAMTNTSTTTPISVRLAFVSSTGSVADSFITLLATQTATFLASDIDPGTVGYMLAIAVDADGCPVSHNALIGDEMVKQPTGHTARLGAVAFKALFSGTLTGCDDSSSSATLNFDGVSYERAPRVVAIDKIPARADGNSTLIVVNRFGGNLGTPVGSIGMANGQLFDNAGTQYDFTFSGTTQFRSELTNAFPVTTPTFETVIPAGTTGWMKVFANTDLALTGAVLNFNPNANAAANAFTGGHNLRALSVTNSSYVMPVFAPTI